MQQGIVLSESDNTASIIHILPPEVSNKIAAGEVVQRPASVVRELLDNAIDSGADRITITLTDSGRTGIRISDNGCGMSSNDLERCFLRHATSKLSSIEDLPIVRTLGFRGEALAAIGSVARVTITTKRVEDDAASELELHGGEKIRLEPAAGKNGTVVDVQHLFYNVPARRAFLKSDATELRHIVMVFQQAALAWPGIHFELHADGDLMHRLPAGRLDDRIASLFGASYKASLIPVEQSTSVVRISGFLSDPKLARRTRGEQFLFINGRPFQHRHLHYNIQNVYKDWIRPGEYPFYALFYEMDLEKVDVNVHPAKHEVKFDDERTISAFTRSVVKKSLNDHMRVPLIEPGQGARQPSSADQPAHRTTQAAEFTGSFSDAFSHSSHSENATANTSSASAQPPAHKAPFDKRRYIPEDLAGRLYGSEESDTENHRIPLFEEHREPLQQSAGGTQARESLRSDFWQIHGEFVLSQTRNGLFIMDQHAAHKRILYEKVLGEAESGLPATQQLLFPLTVHFSATDFTLLKELHPLISRMGFNVQILSGNSAMILGVPSEVRLDNEQDILESILEQYKRMSVSAELPQKERLALAIANKAAIGRQKRLGREEMEALVDQLFACDDPFHDPLGSPTIVSLSVDEVRSLFKTRRRNRHL